MEKNLTRATLQEIEISRGIAILAVVIIHMTSIPLEVLKPGTHSHTFYTIINRGLQFAVPLFLMISALVLAYGLGRDKPANWQDFYRKRWHRAVVPFLVWTTLYILLRLVATHDVGVPSLKEIVLWYGFGKGFYHLYFLSVVIQFYLFFPFIHYLWKRYNPNIWIILVLFGALQIAFYWVNKLYLYQRFPYSGSLVLSYVFPIGIGLWLGYQASCWLRWWEKVRFLVTAVAVTAGFFYLQQHLAIVAGQRINTFHYQIAWVLYVTALAIGVIFLARAMLHVVPLARALIKLGQLSFGIYLVHPFFLALWQHFLSPVTASEVHLFTWGGLAIILTLSALVTYVLERTIFAKPLYGLSKRKAINK
ncbi:acyltransferase 3 [Desulforamulus reducens MI-1]|uniref:Acyltransferase 3 n=1 Tax=Desulforamulus reducens (strain ATCC BAA-1160 / DSM 100696 / MI-1) TaxID=349161 RepID=A4J960_DESRM|nr:acyltransferase [Desulforamulus reducens]ABO51613.1 acyltransferase 3 [Desulforamulus reducens MI-1]